MKTITYNRETRDYDAYLDGDYIGSFATYHDAEVELSRLALERITDEARQVVAELVEETR